ncbi:glycosyltransferase family 2 protein [Parerythrobacter aestuarii]|uniref:glycosyltransferase family 2 protein n=1 Tax=Parerythrobacter aestuarii TaxID=3020909 RepID=UPI0024DE98B6|nr:glycosyltransferase family 2 protein [Parerythrobacter aestuarii]
MSAPSFAVTYTVKDEARLLPDAIKWHRALGCKRFYIFLDGTSDAMRDWLPRQPDVMVRESVPPAEVRDAPGFMKVMGKGWDGYIDARKNLNSWVAARLALLDGIDWLAMIDPDELLLPDPKAGPDPAAMVRLLGEQTPDIAQLLLPNCDVLPDGKAGTSPFAQRHFQARFPALEAVWRPARKALSLVSNPARVARFDQWFWDRALGDDLPRRLVHPVNGETIPAGYFLSYTSHKSILRTRAHRGWRPIIHHWKCEDGEGETAKTRRARVLHFDFTTADAYLHKFGQRRGNREERPQHFAARRAIGDIALDCSDAGARRFFEQCLAVSDPERMAQLVKRGVVLDLPQVAAFFDREGEAL